MSATESPRVSVVVATHRRAALLGACLESCFRQTVEGLELLVVLNPPDEASIEVVGRFDARVLRTHRNLGAFPAKALGIANTGGDYIMVVDDDARFLHDDCLERLAEMLDRSPRLAAVTCNVYGPLEPPPSTVTRMVPLFKDGFTLYRRTVFEDIAGFVPDIFFRAGGESWLANRIYEAGYGIAVRHDARMYHHQTDVGRDHKAMNRCAVRNHALLCLMQEPAVVVPLSLGRKLLSSFARIAIGRRDPGSWAAGWLGFVVLTPMAWRMRCPISLATWRRLRAMRRGDQGGPRPRATCAGAIPTAVARPPLTESPGNPAP